MFNESLIFNQYLPLAQSCVSKYRYSNDYDDLLQEALLGLLNAIRTYEDTHDCSFKTFAYICINNKIKTYNINQKEIIPIRQNYYLKLNTIHDLLPDSLSDIEKEIVYFRLSNYTFKEIATYYKLTVNNIYAKYKKIINKIRIANV